MKLFAPMDKINEFYIAKYLGINNADFPRHDIQKHSQTFRERVARSQYSDWLRAEWPGDRSSSAGRKTRFFATPLVETGSRVHPASYPIGSAGSFTGDKVAGA
jgi:hypothetical protein